MIIGSKSLQGSEFVETAENEKNFRIVHEYEPSQKTNYSPRKSSANCDAQLSSISSAECSDDDNSEEQFSNPSLKKEQTVSAVNGGICERDGFNEEMTSNHCSEQDNKDTFNSKKVDSDSGSDVDDEDHHSNKENCSSNQCAKPAKKERTIWSVNGDNHESNDINEDCSYSRSSEWKKEISIEGESDGDIVVKKHSSKRLLWSDEEEAMEQTEVMESSERTKNSESIGNVTETVTAIPFWKNNDLFDAEDDEDPDITEQPNQPHSDGNVESHERVAIKKPKTLKSQRLLKEEKRKIYSESQRMMRESPLSLPHHTPKQMKLSDFLNRKKNAPATIKIPSVKLNAPTISKTLTDGPAIDSPSLFTEDSPHLLATHASQREDDSQVPYLRLQDSETMELPPEAATCEAPNIQNQISDLEISECTPSTSHSGSATLKSLKAEILANVKAFTPKLNADPNAVVDLDSDDFVQKPSGLNELMDRFTRHLEKRKPREEKNLRLRIVQKETADSGNVTLKQSHVTVTNPAEEYADLNEQTPGSKLLSLKEALREKMSAKKESSRQKRLQLYDLDNENFEDEEEEAEMTDESEIEDDGQEGQTENREDKIDGKRSDEGSDFDEDIKKELFDEESEGESTIENADVDDTTEEEEDITIDKNDSHTEVCADSTSQHTLILDSDDDSRSFFFSSKRKHKVPVITDDDSENEEPADGSNVDNIKSISETSILTDSKNDDDLNASITTVNSEIESSKAADTSFELQGSMLPPYQIPRSVSETSTMSTCTQKSSDMFPMPAEDSQSFFRNDTYTSSDGQSNSFKFYSESPSDTKGSSCKRDLFSEDSQSATNDEGMSELLGLCSGNFKEKGSQSEVTTTQQNNDGSIDELLGLCSGKFTAKATASQFEDNHPLTLVSSKPVISDDESSIDLQLTFTNDEHDEESEAEVDEETGKVGGARFLEDEAELSGSEADSDEDLDLAEEDDVLDAELGDQDALPSEDELRDQVGRVHFKTMLDQDKKELRLYQEMYLEDGDLHGDGETRARSFRWSNAGNDDDNNHIPNNSDGEGEEDLEEADSQWRMQRLEREKWIQEKKMELTKDDEEIGFTHKIKRAKECLNENEDINNIENFKPKLTSSESVSELMSANKSLKGSFLSRKRKSLDKIKQFSVKGTKGNLIGANQSSRNFVFSTLPQTDPRAQSNEVKVTAVSKANGTAVKRAKMDKAPANAPPQLRRSSSLFSYL